MSQSMNPTELKLFHHPKDTLRMTVGDDRSFTQVKPVWAAPLSYPNRYLALLNGKGEEIVTLSEPDRLPKDSRAAVQIELNRRYLTSKIRSVISARAEFGATYWHVETERGEKDFVTQSLQENAQWLSPTQLMLIDVDGNRFEIEDLSLLDARSQTIIGEQV